MFRIAVQIPIVTMMISVFSQSLQVNSEMESSFRTSPLLFTSDPTYYHLLAVRCNTHWATERDLNLKRIPNWDFG
jgi:hypothetical protein